MNTHSTRTTGYCKVGKKKHNTQNETLVKASGRPLRDVTREALQTYFQNLNGHKPGELYDLVLREIEQPLFMAVMDYTGGNQSRAADILGINRGTLRKKLRNHGLMD